MPELPEVEVHRRHLEKWLTGNIVTSIDLRPAGLLAGTTPALLKKRLTQATLRAPLRRGKHLAVPLSTGGALYLHLGMTGNLSRRTEETPAPRFTVLSLHLGNGTVVDFTDSRRFSKLGIIASDEPLNAPPFNALGPDLLTDPPSPARLVQLLSKSRRPLKVLLLEQSLLAGLGNIHTSEALWRARIHPLRAANSLTVPEARRLLTGIRRTFQLVLDDDDGETLAYLENGAPNVFKVYDKTGERCPRCRRGMIQREHHGGRATYWCPQCQKR